MICAIYNIKCFVAVTEILIINEIPYSRLYNLNSVCVFTNCSKAINGTYIILAPYSLRIFEIETNVLTAHTIL